MLLGSLTQLRLRHPATRLGVRLLAALLVTGSVSAVATARALDHADDVFDSIPDSPIDEAHLDPVGEQPGRTEVATADSAEPVEEDRPHEPVNYLLVGSDSRDDSTAAANPGGFGTTDDAAGLADTIMVIRVDPDAPPDGTAVFVLSIPRDTWVTSPDGHSSKINAMYAGEDITQLVDTIRQEFGIAINHTVEIGFSGVQAVVDAVGGVQIELPVGMRDRSSSFAESGPGTVVLDADQAIAFLRSRHAEFLQPDGTWRRDLQSDLSRAERQQYFLRELARTTINSTLTEPGRIDDLIELVRHDLTIDRTLELREVAQLVQVFRGIDPLDQTRVETATLPTVEFNPAPDGSDALRWRGVFDPDTAAFLSILRGEREIPSDVDPALVPVEIADETADGTAADAIEADLVAAGFAEVDTTSLGSTLATPPGIGPPPETTTVIRYAPHRLLEARRVAEALDLDVPLVADDRIPERLGATQVLVILRDESDGTDSASG
jgi:polyisoprenyl-teichoic acid--peptidoglycan teichoic acid transferase